MSDIGKVRIRVPSSIKPGDIVRVRTLVIHPMGRIERDQRGRIIQRRDNYINRVVATYLGKTVFAFDITHSVTENPSLVFSFRPTDPRQPRGTFEATTARRYTGSPC